MRTCWHLSIDVLTFWHPQTLPLDSARLLTPDALTKLITQHALNDRLKGASIIEITKLDIQSVSSNCNNIVFSVKWDEIGVDRDLPGSLFLKLPCKEFVTRLFCNFIDVWRLECSFFRSFSDDCPVRLPKVYAVANKRSRFVLLQENLHADPSVQLFTNADMVKGAPLEVIKSTLATLARFHAHYNALPAKEREAKLPVRAHPFLSPVMSEVTKFINIKSLKPCREKAGEYFSEELEKLYLYAMQHWEILLDWWYREPLTLIHGDSHLGNFFISGDEMGMLDFQAAQWGKGIRDVQYFLINSVSAETLAQHEKKLVQFYLDELERHDVNLSFKAGWEQYRAYSFQTLMTISVAYGLSPLTEKDHVMEEMLKRAVAAIERVNFQQWLEQTVTRASQ